MEGGDEVRKHVKNGLFCYFDGCSLSADLLSVAVVMQDNVPSCALKNLFEKIIFILNITGF